MNIMKDYTDILIEKINKSVWWHITPQDAHAYKKRGKFLASTYNQALFYGKPDMDPERVLIKNPLWSDSELTILKVLFPEDYIKKYETVTNVNVVDGNDYYQKRVELDSLMYKKAKKLGFDAIVLLGSTGIQELKKNRKPRSIELNLCV